MQSSKNVSGQGDPEEAGRVRNESKRWPGLPRVSGVKASREEQEPVPAAPAKRGQGAKPKALLNSDKE